jgi:hypothetical protein
MKHQSKPAALWCKPALMGLMALTVLTVACWPRDGGSNNPPNSGGNYSPVPSNSAGNPSTGPSITITDVPRKGAGPEALETIAGTVSGVNVNECKVVIFARTDTWYVQPYSDSSDTLIQADGTWQSDTHLGSEYAVLLVKNSYKPPTITGTLPAASGAVLAITRVAAKN